MRLELPETGMVYPDQFIPMAERHDYIHTLSKIILNKTCRQIKRLEQEGYQIDRVSVNFSNSGIPQKGILQGCHGHHPPE